MPLCPAWNHRLVILRSLSCTKPTVRSESHALLRYTHICNFIYSHNKSAGFPAPILTTCTNAQQHYVKLILEQALKTQQGVENSSTLSLTPVLDGVDG